MLLFYLTLTLYLNQLDFYIDCCCCKYGSMNFWPFCVFRIVDTLFICILPSITLHVFKIVKCSSKLMWSMQKIKRIRINNNNNNITTVIKAVKISSLKSCFYFSPETRQRDDQINMFSWLTIIEKHIYGILYTTHSTAQRFV